MSEEERLNIAKYITGQVAKTLNLYLLGFTVLIGVMFGWHQLSIAENAKEIRKTTEKVEEVARDFGTILLVSPSDHRGSPFFDDILKKYNPYRGIH